MCFGDDTYVDDNLLKISIYWFLLATVPGAYQLTVNTGINGSVGNPKG